MAVISATVPVRGGGVGCPRAAASANLVMISGRSPTSGLIMASESSSGRDGGGKVVVGGGREVVGGAGAGVVENRDAKPCSLLGLRPPLRRRRMFLLLLACVGLPTCKL